MAQGIGIAQAIGMAVSVGSAVMKLQEGQAQAAQMNAMAANLEAQSQFTRFKAKQDSLKYKKQANDELNKILIRMAQINAAAGAGHMSPFSGNAFGLKIRALSVGGQNFATAKGNEDIVRLMGYAQANLQLSQAGQAREAANAAYKKGVFGAVGALGMGAYSYWKTAIPGGGASTKPASPAPAFDPRGSYFGSGPNYGTYYGKGIWGT